MIVQRAAEVAWVDSGDRIVVLRTQCLEEQPLILDSSAAVVWRLLDDPLSVAALVDSLAHTFDVTVEQIASDVDAFVTAATEAGLLVAREPA